jgi:4-hydroxy-3-polyprenylbenzoate decarboxylase
MEKKRKIVVAVTGASGAIYAHLLLEEMQNLQHFVDEVAVIFSDNASDIWEYELGKKFEPVLPFKLYQKTDFNAPFASGSSSFSTMIICPCSMGILSRIACGISDDLITRSADVMLKERRRLILVPRETPFNLIHIENMRTITLGGGIVCPAIPSFYSKPQNINDTLKTVIYRVLNLAGFENDRYRWAE